MQCSRMQWNVACADSVYHHCCHVSVVDSDIAPCQIYNQCHIRITDMSVIKDTVYFIEVSQKHKSVFGKRSVPGNCFSWRLLRCAWKDWDVSTTWKRLLQSGKSVKTIKFTSIFVGLARCIQLQLCKPAPFPSAFSRHFGSFLNLLNLRSSSKPFSVRTPQSTFEICVKFPKREESRDIDKTKQIAILQLFQL